MNEKNKPTEELLKVAEVMNHMLALGGQKFKVNFALHGELFVKVPYSNSVPAVENIATGVTALTGVKINING